MSYLRAIRRLLWLVAYTPWMYFGALGRVTWQQARGPARRRVLADAFQAWCRGAARIIGMRIVVEGPVPVPPFLVVSNHVGYTDIMALGAVMQSVFVAKSQIGRWPLFGPIVRGVGTLFIDRERLRDIPRVIEQVEAVRGLGFGVVLFPEGTTGDGRSVQPFRPSLLEVAARGGFGVQPAALDYTVPDGWPPAETVVAWVGDVGLLPHMLSLLRVPRFTVRVRFGDETVAGGDRKEVAAGLEARVRDLLATARDHSDAETP